MTAPVATVPASWRWHLERAAAVVLVVLLPLHLLAAVVVGDPAGWSAARLAARWSSPGWRVIDWLTLTVALVHGLGALRRRVPAEGAGAPLRIVLDGVLLVALLVGALVALTYRVV